MDLGTVAALFVAPEKGAPMEARAQVTAVPGRGLDGDRYAAGTGHYSGRPGPRRQVTLVETEAVEAVARDCDVTLDAADTRRNIVTRGVALNHLVGVEFRVGEARLRGIRLCEPCTYLEGLLERPGVRDALVHRGGLNAEVLAGGAIRSGDNVSRSG